MEDISLIHKRIEAIRRTAKDYTEYLEELPIYIPDDGIIAGPRRFYKDNQMSIWKKFDEGKIFLGFDNYHFPINTSFLNIGYRGIVNKASRQDIKYTEEQIEFLKAIKQVYEAAIRFIEKHAIEAESKLGIELENVDRLRKIADNCRILCEGAPKTFLQAVQLFWFTWRLRSPFTSSIGRLDQYLYPFYRRDIDAGVLTEKEVVDILCQLWEAFNDAGTGDTLKNLMLGGVNKKGEDATNELSYLMLKTSIIVKKAEPHLNVRIHSNTKDSFVDKVIELQQLGQGQPTIYNDDNLIPELVKHGIPLESARNYSNDGCTELVIDGESGIFFYQMEAVKSLELTMFNGEENSSIPNKVTMKKWSNEMPENEVRTGLKLGYKSGDVSMMNSFDEVYSAFMKQYLYQTDVKLQTICNDIVKFKEKIVCSPFLSGAFPLCLEKAVDPLRGGFNIECFQLLSGSLTTVADGLAAIKKVVFEDNYCTMDELVKALKNNFENNEILRQRLINAPKFGNDDDFVDFIAADIAKKFCEYVVDYKTPNGKVIWPGLYNIDFNTFAKITGATPDGRKLGDPIAEHYSPTPGKAKNGPTAVINSAAKAPLYMGFASSPLHLTLSRNIIPTDKSGNEILKNLLLAALKLGIVVLNTAIYDAEILKRAKLNPEQYGDIIVRVWGFNARFVDLTEDLQDHIIARIIEE
ncbi:pyruvate formate lyase family protein [Clostridium oryzae]|uniref:Benzylsuccinate synthase alpha subunit n=1 Tax=Clostridium oryzae TaxID=1450648 RepID=A0A1V4IL77_9CLOT|nr:pyruvate formate lyase family protein [Clostridium oryzae]OPJ60590.1 benzylsuccinate synthase alpha subunit [Clostridium oryzae]